ncbi:MAG: hypothetical protein COB41_04860 [Proteobacteria bacterium]|nr:MAG: hypothetical protein COB41_04860 [Pseudomonadota bacterium]
MIDSNFISNLTMTNWRALLQWYFEHLNTSSLIQALQQGEAFSNHDWHTLMVLNINILILFCLIQLFIKVHKQSTFHVWLKEKRSLLNRRLRHPRQTKPEAKISSSSYLKQAYNLHRFAMYEPALEKYKLALQAAPHDLNTYLLGIKIISEMDEPNKKFIQFLLASIAKLRKKNPATWQEVVKFGHEKAPTLAQWQTTA